MTEENPPQAATLKGERLGGFIFGFSRGGDDNVLIVCGFLLRNSPVCDTIVLMGPSGCQSLLREPHLHNR